MSSQQLAETLDDRATRVLLAVATGESSVRQVAARAGLHPSSAWDVLVRLRRLGLVAWTPGAHGTLRTTVEIVAASPW